jgi:uncharacterized membrane protein AbrB (regulator of aidB expression)
MTIERLAADDPAMAQALGIVYVLVAGDTTKHRLPQQTDQCMAAVLAGARIGPDLAPRRRVRGSNAGYKPFHHGSR